MTIGATHSRADVDRLNPVTKLLLILVGNRVRNDDLLQFAPVESINSVSTKDAMRDNRDDILCAILDDHICGLRQCSASVGHVVDDYSSAIPDVSDKNHLGHFVRTRTFLVNQCEWKIKTVRYRCSPGYTLACVRLWYFRNARAP